MNPQDIFVLDCLERFRPMLMSMAKNYRHEFDDLVQDAAVIVLETMPRVDMDRYPLTYLRTVVRRLMWERYSPKGDEPLSLDAPCDEDGLTLADQLEAPTATADHRTSDEKALVVHSAIARLPLDEQIHLQQAHKIYALPLASLNTCTPRRQAIVSAAARRHLRADWSLVQTVYC